ncbi:hypothetical protein CC78DRAFT_533316 [Lojkania enalia]|uniref:Mediator of RNA polymerase II transcription subunit 6 n=1 Tax=Lojkania enalia TaxID=147567 RepID=A0A9P4N429_9PLEO|nr:hypothetical protein CC78DRAFT_533316 [Didymosphaeria enalia]
MPPKHTPLDEIQFENLRFLHQELGGQLNNETVLWYFMNSPFYDANCNNHALLFGNAPDIHRLRTDRKYLEEALKMRFPTGLQFMVVADPQGPGQPWVIQKQLKTRVDDAQGNNRIEIEVRGTYYTVGTKIHMAPSLLDVLRSRMLGISTRLQEVFHTSRELNHWSPATGHTYLPPNLYRSDAKSVAPGFASRLGSPGPSEADLSQALQTSQPVEASTTAFNDDFFLASLALTTKYGHEYMDENPLQGEPGSFVFASTNQRVEAVNKARAEAHTGATLSLPTTRANEGGSSIAPTPKPAPTEPASRKGSVAVKAPPPGKEKRRKSRGMTSPTSPSAPSAPLKIE